jgi:hypothetical protein
MSEYIDPTREFDPSLNCPAHFVAGNPECPACVSNQHPNVQRILSYHSRATPTRRGLMPDLTLEEAREVTLARVRLANAQCAARTHISLANATEVDDAWNAYDHAVRRDYAAKVRAVVEGLQTYLPWESVLVERRAVLAALDASPTEVRDDGT